MPANNTYGGFGGVLGAAGATSLGGMLGKVSIPDMQSQIETPRFMMSIEGVTSSTVEKFQGAIPIVAFTWGVYNDISPYSAGHLFKSGVLRSGNTQIILFRSVQVVTMINSLTKGEKIEQIVIDELAIIGENNVSIETNTYETCYFEGAERVIDSTGASNLMRLTFRTSALTMEFHEYDQDGTLLGSNASSFNFRTAVGGAGGGGGGEAAPAA